MAETDPLPILRDLLADRIGPAEAASRLFALTGPAAKGFAYNPSVFTDEESRSLRERMSAVRQEMAKLLSAGRMPDALFDSPEYHDYCARRTARAVDDLPSPPAEDAR